MTILPKNAGLPTKFVQLVIGAPVAVLSAAFFLFLMEAGATAMVA
jgi:hypothetical protein